MSEYTYVEIKEKVAELEFTNELYNYLSNAKREIGYAMTYNRGVLGEDTEFEEKLRAVLHELERLEWIVVKAYSKEREKLLKKVTEKEA